MRQKKDVAITESHDIYVKQLEADKRVLEERIKELQIEVRTISNLIYRRKSKLFAEDTGEDRNLKNVDRLFFEAVILDALKKSNRGLRTGEIHSTIAKQGYGLNYNTLRSYITRMRDKGLIRKKTSKSYHWIATFSQITTV